jgi:hypothetical protein
MVKDIPITSKGTPENLHLGACFRVGLGSRLVEPQHRSHGIVEFVMFKLRGEERGIEWEFDL